MYLYPKLNAAKLNQVKRNLYSYPLNDFKSICDMFCGLIQDNNEKWYEIQGHTDNFVYLLAQI
jgi:hypothetical protein